MSVQRVSFFLILVLFLAGCTQPKEPEPSLVRLAVMATLESRPTLVPVIVEVTRMATTVPKPIDQPPEQLPSKTTLKDVAPAEVLQSLTIADAPAPTVSIFPTPVVITPGEATDDSEQVAEVTNGAKVAANAAKSTSKPTPEAIAVPEELPTAEPAPEKRAASQTALCPQSSARSYKLIEMEAADTNHPDYLHGDLNLALRKPTSVAAAELTLIDYDGSTDGNAPSLNGLFADGRIPSFSSAHQVYDWKWDCDEHGCPGALLNQFDVALIGMSTAPGEEIRIPSRSPEIYGGGYIAALLYADQNQVTVAYSRDGTVANGYAVHITNLCVDPNLLARYREGQNAGRWQLPLLQNNQPIGTATGDEIQVAIRDRGKFMDPRSRKDWWQ